MPSPIEVEFVEHNPAWAEEARAESEILHAIPGENLLTVHHIGSTAIPDSSRFISSSTAQGRSCAMGAFRDHLRRHPKLAGAYDHEKRRCQALHPDDSHAYADCEAYRVEHVKREALTAVLLQRNR